MLSIFCSALLFSLCKSQVTDPLTGWTPSPSPLSMSYAGATLFTAYQSSANKIWLIGGVSDRIMAYTIGGSWQYVGTFSASLQLGTVNSQCSCQWSDTSLLFANAGKIRQFSWASTPGLTSFNSTPGYLRDAPCLSVVYPDWIFATGGMIITTDGEGSAGQESRYLQIYDNRASTSNIWSRGPNMKLSRGHHACVIHNNYLYAFGGSYMSGSTAKARPSSERLYIGNMPSLTSWSNIAYNSNANVYYHRAVVHSLYNHIYLVGGRDSMSGTASQNIQIYDPATDTLELVDSSRRLNTGRSSPAVIAVGNKIYVFGGSNTAGTATYSSWEVSNTLTFSPTPSPAPTQQPTQQPTPAPTQQPTKFPTKFPTTSPTKFPSTSPTKFPTLSPSKSPTKFPTESPTKSPTNPTLAPTFDPTFDPTTDPTVEPTMAPTNAPTKSPENGVYVIENEPTYNPIASTTSMPTLSPTSMPTMSSTLNSDSNKEPNNGNNIRITGPDTMTLVLFIIIGVFAAIIVVGCILFFLYRSKLKSILAANELNSSPEEDTDVCYDGIDDIQSQNEISNDNDLISMVNSVNTIKCVNHSVDSGKTDGNVYDNNTSDGTVSVGQTDKEKQAALYAMSAAAVIQSAQLNEQMAIEERNKEESQEEGFNVDQFFVQEKGEANEVNENNYNNQNNTTTRDGRTTIGGDDDVTHGGDDVHNQ